MLRFNKTGVALDINAVRKAAESILCCELFVEAIGESTGRGRTYRCTDKKSRHYIAKIIQENQWPEYRVLRYLKMNGRIQVPEVFGIRHGIDNGASVLLISELKGTMLSSQLVVSDDDQLKYWGDKAGKLLRSINSINFKRCGAISEKGIKPISYRNSYDWLLHMIKTAKTKCSIINSSENIIGIPMSYLLQEVENAVSTLRLSTQRPCLVHGDFSPKNIIILNEKNSTKGNLAAIDWEWAKSFESAFDPCRYLIETHIYDYHWKSFWRSWVDGDARLRLKVSAFLIIEVLFHCSWCITEQRQPQQLTVEFIKRFSTMQRIEEWLLSGLN